jgi:colanic acid/amylovoran biosynthesis glycosyltransferase
MSADDLRSPAGNSKEEGVAGVRSERPAPLLILLTNSFPYGQREEFLETEIRYLAQGPMNVRIAPFKALGHPRPLPAGITVDDSLAHRLGGSGRRLLRAASSLRDALSEITGPGRQWPARSWPRALKRLAIHLDLAALSAQWLDRTIQARGWERRPLIVYTYWFTGATFGAVQLKRKYPRMKVVTRAHRGDLYAEVYDPPYIPLRQPTLAGIDQVFAISKHGRSYLLSYACAPADKVVVSRLGVDDPGALAANSSDGALRVVSCSSCIAVKRLGLLVQGVKACATQHPHTAFSWTHLGDGPLRGQIERLAVAAAPSNLSCRFLGHVANQRVLEHYRSNPIDVFLNVSASEGLPVSIMEAQSFGIPVVATAVGGVPEIVNGTTGCLLDADPAPGDVAQAIWRTAQRSTDERMQVKQLWREHFSADRNYREFVRSLCRLASVEA